jgi:hypothetical protein
MYRIGSKIRNCRIWTRIPAFGVAWNLGPEFALNSVTCSRIPATLWLVSDLRRSEIARKRSPTLRSAHLRLPLVQLHRRRPKQTSGKGNGGGRKGNDGGRLHGGDWRCGGGRGTTPCSSRVPCWLAADRDAHTVILMFIAPHVPQSHELAQAGPGCCASHNLLTE